MRAVGQLDFKHELTDRNRGQICAHQRRGGGDGGLDEGSQKVQAPSYKTSDIQRHACNEHSCMSHTKTAE